MAKIAHLFESMMYIKYIFLAVAWILTWMEPKSISYNIILGLVGLWVISDAIKAGKEVFKDE